MGAHVANRVALLMMRRGFPVVGSRILVLGLTFKVDCPDLRDSKGEGLTAAGMPPRWGHDPATRSYPHRDLPWL